MRCTAGDHCDNIGIHCGNQGHQFVLARWKKHIFPVFTFGFHSTVIATYKQNNICFGGRSYGFIREFPGSDFLCLCFLLRFFRCPFTEPVSPVILYRFLSFNINDFSPVSDLLCQSLKRGHFVKGLNPCTRSS